MESSKACCGFESLPNELGELIGQYLPKVDRDAVMLVSQSVNILFAASQFKELMFCYTEREMSSALSLFLKGPAERFSLVRALSICILPSHNGQADFAADLTRSVLSRIVDTLRLVKAVRYVDLSLGCLMHYESPRLPEDMDRLESLEQCSVLRLSGPSYLSALIGKCPKLIGLHIDEGMDELFFTAAQQLRLPLQRLCLDARLWFRQGDGLSSVFGRTSAIIAEISESFPDLEWLTVVMENTYDQVFSGGWALFHKLCDELRNHGRLQGFALVFPGTHNVRLHHPWPTMSRMGGWHEMFVERLGQEVPSILQICALDNWSNSAAGRREQAGQKMVITKHRWSDIVLRGQWPYGLRD